jgi:gluconate 5-dehydrogenase
MHLDFSQAFSLKNKVALVTGGGSGLGLSIATCMAEAGAKVIITGHSNEDKLKDAIKQIPGGSYYLHDVSDSENSKLFVEKVVKDFGGIDILVNNAGVHCKKKVEDITQKDLQDVFSVHLFGALSLTQAVLPYMKEKKEGNIIFISSMSAFCGLNNTVAYSAAKSSLLGVVRTMSSELSCQGIRINAIAPGFIDTPMFHKATDNDPARQAKILGHTPMASYGHPDDIGWGAVYLSSSAASFVTGTCLVIDGGFSIGF